MAAKKTEKKAQAGLDQIEQLTAVLKTYKQLATDDPEFKPVLLTMLAMTHRELAEG